jgi:hypothetical protein
MTTKRGVQEFFIAGRSLTACNVSEDFCVEDDSRHDLPVGSLDTPR